MASILSTIMRQAQSAQNSAISRAQSKKNRSEKTEKDPNQAILINQLNKAKTDRDFAEVKRLSPLAKDFGLNPTLWEITKTPQEIEIDNNRNLVQGAVSIFQQIMRNGTQPQQPQQTPQIQNLNTQPFTTTPTAAPISQSLTIPEGATITIGPKGLPSLSYSPKRLTPKQIAEDEILAGPERKQFLDTIKKGLKGENYKETLITDDKITGKTTFTAIDNNGKTISEKTVKTNLSAATRREQLLADKLTTKRTRINDFTGQEEEVFTAPGEQPVIQAIPGQVRQTEEQRAAREKQLKLTGLDKAIDPFTGERLFTPVIGGEAQETIRGPQVAEGRVLKAPNAEERQRLVSLRTVHDNVRGVRDFIENELKKSGFVLEDFAGPIDARMQAVLGKAINNPEFEKLKSKTRQLLEVVYGLSGKQLNQWELSWLSDDIIPQLSQPGGNFSARLDAFEEWITNRRKLASRALNEVGFLAPLSEDLDGGFISSNDRNRQNGDKLKTERSEKEKQALREKFGLSPGGS